MASTKIDELQLQISSDASTAIGQLNDLATALDNAAASAASLSRANGALNVFAIGLERIAGANLTRAVENLTALSKLDLSNLKNKNIDININVNGATEMERFKYATQDAVKDITKDAGKMAAALGQKYNVDTDGIKELTEHYKTLISALGNKDGAGASSAMYSIFDTIVQHGKMSAAELRGVKEEYLREYNDLKGIQAGTSGLAKTDIERLAGKGFLGNLKKGATGIDSDWSEIVDANQQSLTTLGQTADNTGDQLEKLAERLSYLRDMLEPKDITDDNIINDIAESAQQAVDRTQALLDASTDKHMKKSANKIQLDLTVDNNTIERQIQTAINKATSKTYNTNPIKLKIDQQQLRDNVEAAFASVDIAKLPQFAQGFKDVSNAISTMNQSSSKDSGITKFTNSLRRLIEVDTSKFDVMTFRLITDVITDLANTGDVSKSLNRFVSSIARLANAGDKTKATADGMTLLIPKLKDAIKWFRKAGEVSGSVNQFIAGLASLASAGDKTAITAQNLKALTKEVVSFLKYLRNAPEISDNLAMTIQGLGNLAAAGVKTSKALEEVNNAGNRTNSVFNSALSKAANSVANDFKKVLQIVLKLGASGVKALGSFMQKVGLIPSAAAGIDRTAITFSNLLRAIVPFYGIRGLFDWAKGATEAGSAIVEVENVINTSFGSLKKGYDDISGYIYKWAQTTIDTFGVSELAAKQYAGRLMAMFNSSGFDLTEGMRDSAAKMTTDLIERAGDIASFYDIGVDEAMTKMQAGLAGQVRPLRALGINMSVANMEAFAMSQGINTSWKEMDQASQMALRYQYILYATQYAEGDFAKTSMSMANQVRLLQLNFQMLSTTIGQGLVSAIAPVISWLNALIKRLIQAANAFRTFMWTLFGKPLAAAKGVVNEMAGYMDDAADSASDLGGAGGSAGDGLGSAADSAKELKKNLSVLPFDELNQLAKDTDSASSGGSGGGGAGGGGGIGGIGDLGLSDLSDIDIDSSPTIEAINRWAARIREAFQKHQWANLGRIVAEGINAGFQYIYDVLDWEKLKPKIVDGFITPFQTAFNSMMAWIDWSLVGQTFARGLNDVVYTLRAWITGFDWKAYGGYFAEGLNSMINGWDADAFGRLIADKFKMAWDFFGGWVEDFNFVSLGSKLKIGFTSFLDELDPAEMGDSLADFLNGLADMIIAFFEDDDVVTDMSDAFSEFVNNFLETLDSEKLSQAISTITEALKKTLKESIKKIDKSELATDLGNVLSALPWGTIALAVGAKAGASLATSIFGGMMFKSVAQKLITQSVSEALAEAGVSGGTGAGASAGAGAGASAGAKGAAGVLGTGMSAGAILAGTGIMGGLMALGVAMRKFADEHGGVAKGANLNTDRSFGTTQTAPKAQNAAGYSTQIQTVPQATKTQNVVTTTLKGITDKSFSNLLANKAELFKDPVAVKTGDGNETSKLKELRENFHGIVSNTATKTADGYRTQEFNNTKSQYHGIFSDWATKNVEGHRTSEFNTTRSLFHGIVSNWATKTADGYRTGDFKTAKSQYDSLNDKWVTAHIDVDVESAVNEVYADINGAVETIFKLRWNAKGGLFTRPIVFQGFGEAGAEAAIPLERKSTMKRIASAIVDSGGMTTGNSAELANEIAMRVAPIIMSAVSAQNERPVNVNATLYTEDNEVLARAVNQGNRSLDKRYNPVAQFSY